MGFVIITDFLPKNIQKEYNMDMYVTRKYHRKIVSVLSASIFLLAIFILLILFKPNILDNQKIFPFSKYINALALVNQESASNKFLHEEEAIIKSPNRGESSETILPLEKVLFEYIDVIDGCGPNFEGECLNIRSGPGPEYPVVSRLRNNVVLKIGGKVENNGETWYKIVFDEWLRYPERVSNDWYVSANHVRVLLDEGIKTTLDEEKNVSVIKKIIVNRSTQTLFAYDGDKLFMEEKISTGLELTPTPRGEFTIFRKTPSRYMQGPIPDISNQYYDLPGVPWNLYFTHEGAVIHGAYWHTSFGKEYSHGCVNLPPDKAEKLYNWAKIGTKVIVRD